MEMVSYLWKIHSISKKTINNIDDVVHKIVWEKTEIDYNGNYGSYKECLSIDINNIDLNNIIPYEDLKEEHIIEWIKLNVDQKRVDLYIRNEIEKMKNKDTEIEYGNFPWQIKSEI